LGETVGVTSAIALLKPGFFGIHETIFACFLLVLSVIAVDAALFDIFWPGDCLIGFHEAPQNFCWVRFSDFAAFVENLANRIIARY
jgi:hypothetical protein